MQQESRQGKLVLPTLSLADGYNSPQALRYKFRTWRDFFNDRRLLALSWLHRAIGDIRGVPTRRGLLTLLSGMLEFNNMFAPYKGEGTGAVRHMFAHHILKPERTPIEANVWGTSASEATLFRKTTSRTLSTWPLR